MDLDQRDQRRTAAKDFLDALDELQESLQSLDSQTVVPPSQLGANSALRSIKPPSQPMRKAMPTNSVPASAADRKPEQRKTEQRKPAARFTLRELEMAIADIDNYMQSTQSATTSSPEEGQG